MKTITMPKELADKWLSALRSGKYKQGKQFLRNDVDGSYCCLGVLVDVGGDGEYLLSRSKLPSVAWLRSRGVTFVDSYTFGKDPEINLCFNRDGGCSLSNLTSLNDARDYSFDEIATVIEEHLEYSDSE